MSIQETTRHLLWTEKVQLGRIQAGKVGMALAIVEILKEK
jgi:hypothetical protein